MELFRAVIIHLGLMIIPVVSGTLTLSTSRRPTESRLLNLTCKADQDIVKKLVRFFKGDDVQAYCPARVSCYTHPIEEYTLTRDGTEAVLTIPALNSSRDSGEWDCQTVVLFGGIILSNKINITNIASVFNWNETQLNAEWDTRIHVTPSQNIILSLSTPCTKPSPNFTWKYRLDSKERFSNLIYGASNTVSTGLGCPTGQKKYTNTLTLPGSSLYDKNTLRVEVEHDSFDPNENYIKYKDSKAIRFTNSVPVLSVSINSSNSIDGYEGDTIVLTCETSTSFPAATVTWFKGGTRITGATSSTKRGYGSLVSTISSVSYTYNRTDQDQRIYCQASNPTTGSPAESNKVQLNIFYSPDIIEFKPVTIDEGQILKLSCKVDGRPAEYKFQPFVQYWDGQQVNSLRGDQNGGEYTWSPSAATYLETGEYECSVNNSVPDRSGQFHQKKRVQVLVRGKPVATSDSSPFADGEIGSPVHLFQTFYTSGLPIISFNWTHVNGPVIGTESTSTIKVILKKNGVKSEFDGFNVTLVVADFQQEGIYTVTVCNRLGCTSSTVNVTGTGPPHTPTSFNIVNTTATSITVRWKPGSSGGANFRQTFIVEYRVMDAGDWKPVTFEDRREADGFVYAEIGDLKPRTRYQFRVKSTSNRQQSGNQSQFTQIASKLTKKVPAPLSSSTGAIIGGVIGCIVVVIVVVVVVVLVLRHRRRQAGSDINSSQTPSHGNRGYDTLDDSTTSPANDGTYRNTTGSASEVDNQAFESDGNNPTTENEILEFHPVEKSDATDPTQINST